MGLRKTVKGICFMKCSKCGFEKAEDFAFCPNCGAKAAAEEPITVSEPAAPATPFNEKITKMLSGNLFLTVCILISASTLLSIVSIPVIKILFTIFLWLVYVSAKKGSADGEKMRLISGTVFANYVVNWVVAGALVLLAFIVIVFSSMLTGSGLMDHLGSYLSGSGLSIPGGLGTILSFSGVFIGIILIIVAAVVAVVNYIGIRSIHSFAKSLYTSVQSGEVKIEKYNAAKNWLMALGILSGVGALGSIVAFWSFLARGSAAAAYIIASILIKKTFEE